jgi:hypothetical protein
MESINRRMRPYLKNNNVKVSKLASLGPEFNPIILQNRKGEREGKREGGRKEKSKREREREREIL